MSNYFDDLLLEVERMQAELQTLERQAARKSAAMPTSQPVFRAENVEQEHEPVVEVRTTKTTGLLLYSDVIRMQRELAKVAPNSKLATVKISRRFFSERIEGIYDRESLLETLEIARDVDRSAQAIVKHVQDGNVSLEALQAIYGVMEQFKALGFEQLYSFMKHMTDDIDEFVEFFDLDWFEANYYRVRKHRRQKFLAALTHVIPRAFGGGLISAISMLDQDPEEFEQRIALVPIPEMARLMHEERGRRAYDDRW